MSMMKTEIERLESEMADAKVASLEALRISNALMQQYSAANDLWHKLNERYMDIQERIWSMNQGRF